MLLLQLLKNKLIEKDIEKLSDTQLLEKTANLKK